MIIIVTLLQSSMLTSFWQSVNNKLKEFHPVSIYKIFQTKIEKAKYPVIDFHSHDYPKNDVEVEQWVKVWMRPA
ncbi:MAG: hypothetical protein H0V14_06925 [Chitinophagaceae bacterium]|nr:hypothetical protein [Chitinophagaceae bacterium]